MTMPRFAPALLLSLTLLTIQDSQAHTAEGASTAASMVSMLPVAVSVVAGGAVLSAVGTLSVVAVETSAEGTVWLLERASDATRVSIRFSGQVLKGAAQAAGTAVDVSVIATGTVLSIAGEAICFVPNALGASLLHNEKVSQ